MRESFSESHVTARYRFRFRSTSPKTFLEMVERAAAITSLSGEQALPYETPSVREKLIGKVVAQVPDGDSVEGTLTQGTAEIAYPLEICGLHEGIPLLLSTLQYISVYEFVEDCQLLDVCLPPRLLRRFRGPRFGINGILKLCKRQSPPLLGLILKPRQGLTPDMARKLAFEATLGGLDYIADDELMVSPSSFPFKERVKVIMDSIRRAKGEESGSATVYIANITAEHRKMRELVRIAETEGVQGLMVNVVTMGFDALRELATRRSPSTFLVANTVGRGLLTAGDRFRMSDEVLCLIARAAGADAIYTGPFAGELRARRNSIFAISSEIQKDLGNVKPCMAVVSGGVGLTNILQNAEIYRENVMISMGMSLCRLLSSDGELAPCVKVLREVFELYRKSGSEAYKTLLELTEKDRSLDRRLRMLGWAGDLLNSRS